MATPQVAIRPTGNTRFIFLEKYFYFSMSLLVAAVVVYGFSHTVDRRLLHATPSPPWILWAHGIVMTGWFGAGLGALIPVLGISTAVIMDRFFFYRLHAPHPQWFIIIQIWDMTAF